MAGPWGLEDRRSGGRRAGTDRGRPTTTAHGDNFLGVRKAARTNLGTTTRRVFLMTRLHHATAVLALLFLCQEARATDCSAAPAALLKVAQALATEWTVAGRSRLRLDSAGAGAEVSIPTRISPSALETKIAHPVLLQTIEISDPGVLREFAGILARQQWSLVDRAVTTIDFRYRVLVTANEAEQMRLYVGTNNEVLFANCTMQATTRDWFRSAWNLALANLVYGPRQDANQEPH